MRQPAFLHLTGRAMWTRCDHRATRIEGAPARVTLATATSLEAPPRPVNFPAWRAAMGAAVLVPCAPDACEGWATLLADPARGLFVLRDGAWAAHQLPAPGPYAASPSNLPLPLEGGEGGVRGAREAQAAPPSRLDFAPTTRPAPVSPPRALARDSHNRLWLLDITPPALRLLGPDLRLSARVALPPDARPFALACAAWGVVLADAAVPRLLVQAWGGAWLGITLPAAPLALAADPRFATAIAVLDGGRIAILRGASTPEIHPLPALDHPLHAVMTAEDRVLIADVAGTPGSSLPTRVTEFLLTPTGPEAERGFAVRGFDGRALWLDAEGHPLASTPTGARRLYAEEPRFATDGAVETFALDSGIFACVWHRVFLDACVPPGTSLEVEARTADTLPPRDLRRSLRPPADRAEPLAPDPAWPPLGTLAPEEEIGWSPVGLLDRRPAHADTPTPPFATATPSEDALRHARGHADPPPPAMLTLEGLVKAPPGRWLWLRVRLRGTARRAPALFAIRATFPRPSLLDSLPAYWRGDPVAAEAPDRALALFEGFATETDSRLAALCHLFAASTAPREALDWLAGFVALAFDARVEEDVRRSLLAEAAALWRRRGTVPGLARLLSILARAPVQVIEGFRLRRESVAALGTREWGALGPGLQLGDDEGPDAEPAEPWERGLELKHAALALRRAATRAAGDAPCPGDDPPAPLDPDPLIRFHRRFAHRFTVIVPARRTDDLAAVLDLATETHKPAHTLHRFCWLDAGFRLGAGSLIGIARIGERDRFMPGVIGDAPLGADRTIGRAVPEDRLHLGATRLQQGMRWP